MKLTPTHGDNPRTDAHLRGRETASTESAGQAGAFGDVLADVEGNAAEAGANASGVSASLLADAGSRKPATTGLASGDTADATVGSLLKRLKSKSDDADAHATDTTNASVDPSLSSLVVGFQVAPNPSTTPTNGIVETKSAAAPLALPVSPTPPGPNPAPGIADHQQEAGIFSVSLATHVAPLSAGAAVAAAVKSTPQAVASSPPVGKPQAGSQSAAPPRSGADVARAEGQAKSADTVEPTAVAPTAARQESADQDGSSPMSQKSIDSPLATATQAVAPHQPIKSIAAAVVDLAVQSPASAATETVKTQLAMARTVTLQMSPADLGTVEVRLHLSGHALDLHLTMSERETAGLVTRERDRLTTALQTQGYDLQSLVIQDSSGAASSGGSNVANHQPSTDARSERQGGNNNGSAQTGGNQQEQDGGRQGRSGTRRENPAPSRAGAPDQRVLVV